MAKLETLYISNTYQVSECCARRLVSIPPDRGRCRTRTDDLLVVSQLL